MLGNAALPHTYTYLPDIARGLVMPGERDEALGEAWHFPAAETLTTREFVHRVFVSVGGATRVRSMPRALMAVVGLFNADVRELREMMYEFEEPFVLDHSKFTNAFGDIATPLSEGILATTAWYREQRAG